MPSRVYYSSFHDPSLLGGLRNAPPVTGQGPGKGRAGFVTDDVENITGIAPRTFRDWCERNASAFN
jgi:hypothetical protein